MFLWATPTGIIPTVGVPGVYLKMDLASSNFVYYDWKTFLDAPFN